MEIRPINHQDGFLPQVIALADQNKKTLGMLPHAAFLQHARKKTIIVAVENGTLAGYLLYRISQKKRMVSVTHLCLSKEYHGKGVAIALLHELKVRYENLFSGIMLTCRADYLQASRLWEKFGFKARDKKPSRSKTGQYYLVRWVYDFGNPHLFSISPMDNQRVKAVLDCSVVIPLSENESSTHPDVNALNADWLEDEVDFVCAQEIFNDVNRDENISRADNTRKFIRKFDLIQFKPDERDRIATELKAYITGDTPNHESDRKQLAECISAGVKYFITLDKEILELNDKLSSHYPIEILRPVEFVVLLDGISNSLDYRSFRLAGANYDSTKVRGREIEKLVSVFSGAVPNENKQDLRRIITECIQDARTGHVKVIKDRNSETLAAYGVRYDTTSAHVNLIRIKRSRISTVLFQQLIRDIILSSLVEKIGLIRVTEPNISTEEKSILAAMGFIFIDNHWEKFCSSGIRSLEEVLSDSMMQKLFDVGQIRTAIRGAAKQLQDILKVDLERKIWPLKIREIQIPVYIIPIKPYWASQLFDFYLANTSLFGAAESLTWSRENVYYRSVHPVSERSPGRILWYVSGGEKVVGRSSGIVATSYLDEVTVDRTKEIFQKYKNYGVYEWNDVYNLANREILSEIKALKFSDTEVFKNIIPLKMINTIMAKYNRAKNTFASPVEVSIEIFNEIYQIGING